MLVFFFCCHRCLFGFGFVFVYYHPLNKSGSLVFSVFTIANKILTWRNALLKMPLCPYENKKNKISKLYLCVK